MADDKDLEAIQSEYTRIRDDSRNFWAVVAALFSVAVAIVGGLAVLAQQTCPEPHVFSNCTDAPSVLWFLAPLAPTTVAVLVIQQVALSTIRSSYERALEERLARILRVELSPPSDIRVPRDLKLPSPSYSRFANRLFDVTRAEPAFRILILLLNAVGAALLIGAVWMSVLELTGEGVVREAAVIAYGLVAIALGYAAFASLNGPKMWNDAVKATADH